MELRSWGSVLHPLSTHSSSCCAHQHVPNFLSSGKKLRSALDNVTVLRFLSFKQIYTKGHDDWMSYIKQYKTFEFQVLKNSPLCSKHGTNPLSISVFWNQPLFSWGFISRLRHGSQWQATELAGTEKEFIKRSWSKTLVRTKLGCH